MSLLLSNAQLILDPSRGVVPGWLLLRDGVIKELGSLGDEPAAEVTVIDCSGDFIAPGLVDIHLHGAVGRDAMEASEQAFGAILGAHARYGTTTAVLTTVAASLPEMIDVLQMTESWPGARGVARLAGIHLEGPWFSPRRRGAHDPAQLRDPRESEISAILEHASVIRRVTLAPELPGAYDAIRTFREAGIAVSAGHSDATEREARAGFKAGITQATHLHNAMSSLRKTDPPRRGLAEAALENQGMICELIADGMHVPPDLLRETLKAKGWENLALVSDATAGCGLPEGSGFRLGDLDCVVQGKAAWTGEGIGHCLAGSTAPLFTGIRTMMEQAGATISEAVAMATLVPSRALGTESEVGSLEIGKQADLIRFTPNWEIKGVWIGGEDVKAEI
jgi:N-acetylglucosamine-6-phosphate deacetylase